jgi:uncharacterized protein (TIGR03435 family)
MAALAFIASFAQAAVPEGQPAPAVHMKLLKDGKLSDFPGWNAYKGKVVVVELWGTWCAGCVADIPHMNALQKAFQGKPVEFISVTAESAATVSKFQKRHPMSGTVGVGGDDAIKLLGSGSFPQTVIISKTGTVLRYTQPEEVSEKALAQLLDTGSASNIKPVFIKKESAEKNPKKKEAKEPMLEVRVDSAPSAGGNSSSGIGAGSAEILNFTGDLRFMLSQAYDINEQNIEISSGLPQQRLSFFLRVPRVSGKEMLSQVIKTAYGVEVRSVNKDKSVLLLQYDKDMSHSGLVPSKNGGSFGTGPGAIHADGTTVGNLLGFFEMVYGMPVVDETGLTESYKINIEWTPGNKDALSAVLKGQLGMTLVQATRSVEMLEVFPAAEASPEN